jgi:hypothetical protein
MGGKIGQYALLAIVIYIGFSLITGGSCGMDLSGCSNLMQCPQTEADEGNITEIGNVTTPLEDAFVQEVEAGDALFPEESNGEAEAD